MRKTVRGKAGSSKAPGRLRVWTGMAVWSLAFLVLALPAAATTIAGGYGHSLGVRTDGSVAAWGYDNFGQCSVPADLTVVVAVAAGSHHSLALKTDGRVVAWGDDYYDQCSDLPDLTGVVAVAAGYNHSLALKSDGRVAAWGSNSGGQITVPADLTGVVAVAAGYNHSLALKSDGRVVAWGNNAVGQTTVPSGLTDVMAVAAGFNHSLALKSDGTVVAWGQNNYDQSSVPSDLTDVVAVAAGSYHSLALKSNGRVVAWGRSDLRQTNVPADLSGVVAIGAGPGAWHSLALKSDGSVVGWGYHVFGQCTPPSGVTFMLPNRPPQANAGGNVDILSKDQAANILPGTASDPDGDSLTYRWLEGTTELISWQPVQNGQAHLDLGTLPLLPLCQHNLTLEVSDGKVTSSDSMVLTLGNSAPNAAPTGAGTYQVNTQVSLGGQVSDFDGDPLTYRWLNGTVELTTGAVTGIQGGAPIDLTPFLVSNLSVGEHEFTLEVCDGTNVAVCQSIVVKVINDTAPTLSPTADKTILWPPDKKMVTVTILANAGDNSGLPVTLTASVSCNEPNGSSPYWTVPAINQDTGIITVQLQADRLGKGKGRMYSIGINATDQFGNMSYATVVVSVPHDQGNK